MSRNSRGGVSASAAAEGSVEAVQSTQQPHLAVPGQDGRVGEIEPGRQSPRIRRGVQGILGITDDLLRSVDELAGDVAVSLVAESSQQLVALEVALVLGAITVRRAVVLGQSARAGEAQIGSRDDEPLSSRTRNCGSTLSPLPGGSGEAASPMATRFVHRQGECAPKDRKSALPTSHGELDRRLGRTDRAARALSIADDEVDRRRGLRQAGRAPAPALGPVPQRRDAANVRRRVTGTHTVRPLRSIGAGW